VTGENEISVGAAVTPTTTDHTYWFERQEEGESDWEEAGFVISNGAGGVAIVDQEVDPSIFSYTYRVIAQNICGDYVDTSNIGKTILLEGLANPARLVNTIVWSDYEGWENGIALFNIYRSIGEGNPETLIATVNGSINFYEDDVAELLFTEGEFCYRVEAVEVPNFLGIQSTSSSNILCLAQEPKIWIPSAFVIDGFNNVFQPVISFADFTEYKMIIFSRWGDFIYETEDILAPWDGTMNGKLVQEGAYVYYVAVKDGEGRLYERRGTVTMLVGGD
jgi:gliding motility-associated-like protein